ncbi:uncharacterized protein [Magallana gigas]|uniref:uncharacterized protein isoform X2 n=1 Tax=Magallana gigas TaxID=29159 RepID=UPI00333E869C
MGCEGFRTNMAALSYGKRCLKAVLENDIKKKKKRLSPDAEAQRYCEAGLDKDGFEVKYISDYKGFGVFSVAEHAKGDFLLQYAGEKITKNEATERMKKSTENKFFFYCYKGQDLCIDAEGVSNSICHFVNDADKTANSVMKLKVFHEKEYLCLYAMKDIQPGEEIQYNYGDKENLWWRSKDVCKFEFEDDDCDDIDDDPFDIRKISDVSSEEDYISDSCSDSLQSEIIQQLCFKTKNFKPADLGQREENTGEVFNEDDGQMDLEQREENTGEVFNEDDGQMDLEQREENTGEVFNEDDGRFEDSALKSTRAKPKKERPGRMCVFCSKIIEGGKLKRHITSHKKTHEEVAAILKKPVEEQNKWFEEKRHEGIYKYNMHHLDDNDTKLMRERKPKTPDELRMCLACKKFFSNRTFYKHKETCSSQAQPVKTKTLRPLDLHYSEEFVLNILNKFRDGSIGNFIRESKIVQTIGYKHYLARRSESSKTTEVRREVMMEMRELSRLFFCFKSIAEEELSFEEMYERNHLSTLKEAFSTLCTGEEGEKYGLKMNLNSIFQRSIKILLGYYSETQLDSKVKELERFRKAYNFNLPDIVGKARYHTEKNSLKKARLPKSLPLEDEMRKLKQFLIQEIDDTVENFSLNRYTWLRSLVVARLTLYHARRGEEGSRLLLEEWYDAINSTWIPQEAVESVKDDAEKYLIGQYKLAYMAGKGRKCVPVLIPNDLVGPIELLISHRQNFGIAETNNFLFATKSSSSHCSGWHAVFTVCEAVGISSVTATKNRHRVSTVYATLDMSENDRKIFYDHLGHNEAINKDNYQCPPGVTEVLHMGKFLSSLEDGLPVAAPESHEKKTKTKDTRTQSAEIVSEGKKQRKDSFRWTEANTKAVITDFKEWVNTEKGSSLPSKTCLEEYLSRSTSLACTVLQLRTKIMNEQNKRKKNHSNRLKKLSF